MVSPRLGINYTPYEHWTIYASAGHGFVNMADRLGAFGGRVDVTSAPGAGTKVAGFIPLTKG